MTLDSLNGFNFDTPIPYARISTQGQARLLGISHAMADRIYGINALIGHGLMAMSGKFTGNYWEIFTGLSWASSSLAMVLWPARKWTIPYVGATVIAGSATLVIGALHKDHNAGVFIFGGLALARSSILLLSPSLFPDSKIWQKITNTRIARHKKEINSTIAYPSRYAIYWDAFGNHQPLVAAAAAIYSLCDIGLFISGRTEKKMQILLAGRASR